MLESIVVVILLLAVVGFLVYLITENIPMAAPFKQTIIAVAVIALVLWLLAVLFGGAPVPRFPRFNG